MHLLRHGFTSLRRTPTLAVTIVITLALALAASVVVFTFLNTFLLRPLPYGDAARLTVVFDFALKDGQNNSQRLTFASAVAIQEQVKGFSRTALFRNESATFHGGDGTETAFVQRVSANVFPLLGAHAALGTTISAANEQTEGVRSVVLSDSLWRRRFGADPAIIGRLVQLDATPYRVVGVMGPDFVMPTGDDSPQAWPVLLATDIVRNERTQRRHHFLGELAPGKTLGAVNGELSALAATQRQEFPKEYADRGLVAVPLRDQLLGGFDRQLVLLQGAVLLVLVVACFNCLCLLIARAIQRRREFAVRLALGAARRHLLAQLFAESLWLALPAAVLALLLAETSLPLGHSLLPQGGGFTVHSMPVPHLDGTVVGAVVATALLVALAFSLVPLLQTRRINLEAALREGGRSAGSPAGTRAARFLAAAQVAVALALLISAALLVRTRQKLERLDVGVPFAELDQFRIGLRGAAYQDPLKRLQFYERLRDGVRTIPGVSDVGVASFLFTPPPAGYQPFVQEGDGLQTSESPKRALPCYVLPDMFAAIGLRLVEGRYLNEGDTPNSPLSVVISASLAAKYWPGESPLGKRVRMDAAKTEWAQVVGVVSDLIGPGNQPQVIDVFYGSIAQFTPPGLGMGFIVRHRGAAPDDRSLQRAVAALDPNMQLFAHLSPAKLYADAAWQTRFVTHLVTGFALLAVTLALAGIYAVNSFFVARRMGEFGIRAALGASAHDLLGLVLRDSLRLTALGLAAGAVLAYFSAHALAGLLYGTSSVDFVVYLAAGLVMTAACAAAAYVPARRASKVDPLVALRTD